MAVSNGLGGTQGSSEVNRSSVGESFFKSSNRLPGLRPAWRSHQVESVGGLAMWWVPSIRIHHDGKRIPRLMRQSGRALTKLIRSVAAAEVCEEAKLTERSGSWAPERSWQRRVTTIGTQFEWPLAHATADAHDHAIQTAIP